MGAIKDIYIQLEDAVEHLDNTGDLNPLANLAHTYGDLITVEAIEQARTNNQENN